MSDTCVKYRAKKQECYTALLFLTFILTINGSEFPKLLFHRN